MFFCFVFAVSSEILQIRQTSVVNSASASKMPGVACVSSQMFQFLSLSRGTSIIETWDGDLWTDITKPEKKTLDILL